MKIKKTSIFLTNEIDDRAGDLLYIHYYVLYPKSTYPRDYVLERRIEVAGKVVMDQKEFIGPKTSIEAAHLHIATYNAMKGIQQSYRDKMERS